MRKISFAVVFLMVVEVLSASPLLVESYQLGTINFPVKTDSSAEATGVSFSVDTNCYVQLIAGGLVSYGRIWLELDGDSLFPTDRQNYQTYPTGLNIVYVTSILKGNHDIKLMCASYINTYDPTLCQNAYLQALIFLPDSASAVAEQPALETSRPVTNAVISRGPYVSAPGASMVVDASGRVMENVLTEGKVQISTLPAGTYYAKDEERTVVKIVKVD